MLPPPATHHTCHVGLCMLENAEDTLFRKVFSSEQHVIQPYLTDRIHYNTLGGDSTARLIAKSVDYSSRDLGAYWSAAVVVSLNGNNGNAGEPSGNWCLGSSPLVPPTAGARGYQHRKIFEIIYRVAQKSKPLSRIIIKSY